jgi:hypothetical protein
MQIVGWVLCCHVLLAECHGQEFTVVNRCQRCSCCLELWSIQDHTCALLLLLLLLLQGQVRLRCTWQYGGWLTPQQTQVRHWGCITALPAFVVWLTCLETAFGLLLLQITVQWLELHNFWQQKVPPAAACLLLVCRLIHNGTFVSGYLLLTCCLLHHPHLL